jgi:hypothetical protein
MDALAVNKPGCEFADMLASNTNAMGMICFL